jgi:hypothetical protein
MNFRAYLNELANIETGQAIEAHEPTGEASSAISNPKIRMQINFRLMNELDDTILSPEAGIQKIRKVLAYYGLDMPALYDADFEGDELVIEIEQFSNSSLQTNIYILYYLTDEGRYDFYAEVGNDERMEELLSDEEDLEENQ